MVTLTQAVQFGVRKQALAIHDLKASARVVEPYEKYGYVSPDGRSFSAKRPSDPEKADWKPSRFAGEKVVAHMSPRSHDWARYRSFQNQASLLLTSRLILKCAGDAVPSIQEFRAALREGKITHHARPGHRNRLAFKAYRYLKKLANRLERRPEAFAEAQTWIESVLGADVRGKEEAGGHAC
jgi:hypothetical protein